MHSVQLKSLCHLTQELSKTAFMYRRCSEEFESICLIKTFSSFLNQMNYILDILTHVKQTFHQIIKNEYKLCLYAIEQVDTNEKFLNSLSSITTYDMQYEEHVEQLSDFRNIVKFKTIISAESFFNIYIELNFDYIERNTFQLFNTKYMPVCVNNYFETSNVFCVRPVQLTIHHVTYIYELYMYLMQFINNPNFLLFYKKHVMQYVLSNVNHCYVNYVFDDGILNKSSDKLYIRFKYIQRFRMYFSNELIEHDICKMVLKRL
jgi:hypothetical protein